MSRALNLVVPGAYWEVVGGAFDVFLTEPSGGRLHPLVSLEPGTLVGGLSPAPGGRIQLGRPAQGASVRECGLAEVAARGDALVPWLTGLLAAGHPEAAPRGFVSIRAGETVALAGRD